LFSFALKHSKKRAKKTNPKEKNDKNNEFYVILLTPNKGFVVPTHISVLTNTLFLA